jgi:hypothetical protein
MSTSPTLPIDCGQTGIPINHISCKCPYPFSGRTDELRNEPTCAINVEVIRYGYLVCLVLETIVFLPLSMYHVYCILSRRQHLLLSPSLQAAMGMVITPASTSMSSTRNAVLTSRHCKDIVLAISGLFLAICGSIAYGVRSLNPTHVIGIDSEVTWAMFFFITSQIVWVGLLLDRVAMFTTSVLQGTDTMLRLLAPWVAYLYCIPPFIGGPILWLVELQIVQNEPANSKNNTNTIFEQIAFSLFKAMLIVCVGLTICYVLLTRLEKTLSNSEHKHGIASTIWLLNSTRKIMGSVALSLFILPVIVLSSTYVQRRSSYVYLYLSLSWIPQHFIVLRWGLRQQEIEAAPYVLRFLLQLGSSNYQHDTSHLLHRAFHRGHGDDERDFEYQLQQQQQQRRHNVDENVHAMISSNNNGDDDGSNPSLFTNAITHNTITKTNQRDSLTDSSGGESPSGSGVGGGGGIYAPSRRKYVSATAELKESHGSIPDSAAQADEVVDVALM